jgi:putative membrane protein
MKKLTMLFLFFAITATAKAQEQSPDTTAWYFLVQASIGNLQEIASGKLAMQKAASPNVKAFGKMMVDDHSKAQAKLLAVAQSQNIQLPSASTATPLPDMTLATAANKDFDRLYVHSMVPGHRQTFMMFQNYAITGKNAAVKAFANETLPTLKQHLQAITTIDKNMKYQVAK